MNIEIIVDFDSPVQTYIRADGSAESTNPISLLEKALEAIQWEIDNYHSCPIHKLSVDSVA